MSNLKIGNDDTLDSPFTVSHIRNIFYDNSVVRLLTLAVQYGVGGYHVIYYICLGNLYANTNQML